MKKRTAFIIFIFLAGLVLISGCVQNTGSKEEKTEPDKKQEESSKQGSPTPSTAATVNFDTSKETKISRGFQGQNNPIQKGGVEYLDDDLIQIIHRAELGWIRFGGGTVVGDYNWKLGIPEEAKIVQYNATGDHGSFGQPHIFTVAKGGQQLSDFYELARLTSTNIIVTVNPFTDTPESIGDMAKFVKDNHIDVEYWQMGNEPYYFRYVGNMAKKPQFFTSATDYLNKVKPFSDAIKAVLPNAKTLVYYSPDPADRSNNEITDYPDRFWDGITFHRYDGNGKDTASAIKDTNTQLTKWEEAIDQYIKKSWSDVPIVVTEYGVKIKGKLEGTHYAGMYVAESALRASKHTNIKYMGGYRLYGGLANEGNPRSDQLEAAYQKEETVDTKNWDFDFYSTAPSVDLQAIYPAINRSDALWDTTVSGGLTVETNTSKIPALYAQAYKGTDGSNYVVIVNKSAKEHQVTITQDGKAVDKKLTKTFVSAGPSTRNSAKNPDNVKLQEDTSANPVAVPAYSIVRLEWSARPAEALSTRLTHAQITGKDSVTLKWQPLRGIDSYIIQYGTASGKYSDSRKVDQATEQTISGLSPDTPYYFVVYPGTHKELLSNEMSAVIAAPATPQLTRVYPLQGGALGIEWRSVEGATGYKIQYGTSAGSLSSTLDVGNVDGHRLTGLQENTAYYVTVLAYNGAGESGSSEPFSTVTEKSPAYAPNNLQKVSQNGGKVTFKWDSSSEAKDSAGAGYKVYRSTKPYPLSDYQLLGKVKDTTYTDSGLTTGQTYYYTVTSDQTYGSDPAHPNYRLADNSEDAGPVFGNSNIFAVTVNKSK